MAAGWPTTLVACLIGVVCLGLKGCSYLPESTFDLARESRLPPWFTLPVDLSRADVTVTMSYDISTAGATATFRLQSAKRMFTLAEVNGIPRILGAAPVEGATARVSDRLSELQHHYRKRNHRGHGTSSNGTDFLHYGRSCGVGEDWVYRCGAW